VGYLRDFLFTNEQVKGTIAKLSGGERKRLQLARILARPCNVLVLDEPTNDLDLETMELLEDLLIDYPGTLLVVSHDRTFLDDVVTSTLVCEQPGVWSEYVGGYQDWLRQRPQPEDKRTTRAERNAAAGIVSRPRRASFKEKRELAELPLRIEALEVEKHALFERMAAPGFYAQGNEQTASATARLAALEREHQLAYARWQELDSLLDGSV
jgi:ABC transport system ATP-binding/permease protein